MNDQVKSQTKDESLNSRREGDKRLVSLTCALLLLTIVSGCSREAMEESALETAQQSYDEAVTAMESMNHTEAASSFGEAIESGGLSPDQLASAHYLRGVCYVELGKLDLALSDLEIAGEGYGNLDEIHELRAAIFEAQGDPSKAAEERRLASEFRAG